MRFKSIFAIAALAALLLAPIAQASVQFSHPYDEASTTAFSSFYFAPGNGAHQSFADYYWDGSFSITDFHWWGLPEYNNSDIDGFVFQIYDQAAGAPLPGNLLYEQFVDGDANAAWVDYNDQYAYDVYSYWLDLTTPFTPATAGNYWFSVYAISDGDLGNWYWALGDGDPFQADWMYVNLTDWMHLDEVAGYDPGGFAFEITGDREVPEPTTLALFGIGLVGMAVRRLRRK